ncbi:uncharacterized protein LOC120468231 [Pimephales promelas]|uniref:uncharacterized protein LOC120468231 n=1 Tax=Pimephales promelas TaxID=90988 RepID=UPI0019555CAD|nr:uncharacterized protein LOC120468231 [Pimephales promelas]
MLKLWWIQRIHILRGCLSDPEVEEGILYRYGGTLQLNHVKGEGAAVPIWIPIRGTSQQRGFISTRLSGGPPQTVIFKRFSTPSAVTVKEQTSEEFLLDAELPSTPPLPLAASPCAARTGPIKTGGRVFVLDHNRWTDPMRNAIDGLLAKHHGSKDLLTKVDAEYAAMVQSACTDPNSLLHSTTKQHISRYIKHLAKKKNTNASLNTSPEKLLETQQLWQRLHSGSETISVPVTVLPPAPVNPPAKSVPEAVSLDQAALEKMVKDIIEKQQAVQKQQQQQMPQKKLTRSCLACGQPKSRYMGDGTSIHFFYQGGDVKYFYCSKKVFDTYSAEGLTNPRMPFEDFAATPFFQRELESSKRRGAENKRVIEERSKRKSVVEHPTGRLCRFCHLPLKQGQTVLIFTLVSLEWQAQGMSTEMSWRDFQQSPFYEAEKKSGLRKRKK